MNTLRAILYARVTTSDQREASLDDQIRECEDLCKREGFEVVARETDFGMSGESKDRPGYQRVLLSLTHGDADVVVAHELSRLWRSPAEQATQLEQCEFLGRHVVTNDFDSRRSGSEFLAAVKGAQSKTELRQLASRVHRTHKGLAIAGRSTGGRTYGYKSEPILDGSRNDAYGRPLVIGATRVIDAAHAEVVRRIFTMYADGNSPRTIASILNAEGVPSPGATWQRKTRRTDAKWLASAIHGDPKRGSGILNCETYVGRVMWNRRQMKKRPGTSKRVAFKRTAADLITREDPTLRIIDDALWQLVKDRQAKQSAAAGAKVRDGLHKKARAGECGRQRHLLSGLLRCGVCRSSFQMTNKTRYQCASHHNGGDAACPVSLSVLRDRLQDRVMDLIEHELLVPGRLADLEQRLRDSTPIITDYTPRIAELAQREKNLATAIAAGGDMTALLAALKATQTERERMERGASAGALTVAIQSPAPASYERRVEELKAKLAKGGDVARAALAEITGGMIMLDMDESGRFFWAIFEDGVRAALLADAELMGVAYCDPSAFGLVESSGSGGPLLSEATFCRVAIAA